METTELTYAAQGMIYLTPAQGVQSPELEAKAIREALAFWAFLACRTHTDQQDVIFDSIVEKLASLTTVEELEDWTHDVFTLAYDCEREMCPNASRTFQDGILELVWEGTFTPGRWYRLTVYENNGEFEAYMAWDTGKDVPSTYLDEIQKWWDIPGVVTDDRHSS